MEKKRLVLVVDDHPKVLRFIEIDLKLHGFEVITTTSGQEAVELVKSKKPDIMLLDIVMPKVDGLQVLEQVRSFSRLPIITFSARPSERNNAIRLGADDFITKPFRPGDMLKKIETLLEN